MKKRLLVYMLVIMLLPVLTTSLNQASPVSIVEEKMCVCVCVVGGIIP